MIAHRIPRSETDGRKTWPCVTCEAPVYRKESECANCASARFNGWSGL